MADISTEVAERHDVPRVTRPLCPGDTFGLFEATGSKLVCTVWRSRLHTILQKENYLEKAAVERIKVKCTFNLLMMNTSCLYFVTSESVSFYSTKLTQLAIQVFNSNLNSEYFLAYLSLV